MNNEIQLNEPKVMVIMPSQECEYCKTSFVPTRRFVQKFCSESCRVMACRERKENANGIVVSGKLYNKRNSTTNTELKNEMVQILELMKFENEKNRLANQNALLDIQIQLKKDMQKIISKQNWNMFLTVLIPIIAPLLSSWAAGLFNKAETAPLDVNSFLKKLDDDFGDRVTPEMKAQIILAMGNIF